MAHEYTVATTFKKVIILTDSPHTDFNTVNLWIKHHRAQIAAAAGVPQIGLEIFEVFYGGRKIK